MINPRNLQLNFTVVFSALCNCYMASVKSSKQTSWKPEEDRVNCSQNDSVSKDRNEKTTQSIFVEILFGASGARVDV